MTTFQPSTSLLTAKDAKRTNALSKQNTQAVLEPAPASLSAPRAERHNQAVQAAPNRAKQIYSRNNIHIRRIRDLWGREERDRAGTFFVTGLRFLIQAAQQNARIETVVTAPKLLTSVPGQRLVRKLRGQGIPCLEVPPEVLHNLSLSDDPQGIGAVIRQRWEPIETIKPGRELCWLALDTVQSPGNLGTILRSCDAVGCAGVIFLDDATDPYDPACVRASMGALYARRFARCTPTEFLAWKQQNNITLVGTSPRGSVDYQQTDYPSPLVLFMGGERKGLPPEFQAVCDRMARIPMVGTSDSLNLAMATSVMLYEVFNQRRNGTRPDWYNKGIIKAYQSG